MPNRDFDFNRFHDLSRAELYEACHARASMLMGLGGGRSTAERFNLTKDTAHLLLAVAPTMASGEHAPGTPAQAILQGSEDFLPAFLTAHEIELRQVRYRTRWLRVTWPTAEVPTGGAAMAPSMVKGSTSWLSAARKDWRL